MKMRSLTWATLCLLLFSVSPPIRWRVAISEVQAQESQSVEEKKAIADQLFEQGNQQFDLSQFREALQSWEQALSLYREIGDRRGEGRSLGHLGNVYDLLGAYEKAIDFQQQSLAIARAIGDRRGAGNSLGSLGNAYYSLGDYEKAIEYHQQHLAISKKIGNRLGEGASLGNLGNAYYSLGDYQKAISFQQRSLAIAKEIGDRLGEGQSLGNLGNAYYSLGNYQKAIDFQQQSLAIAEEIGDRLGKSQSLGNLGSAYYALGNYEKALDYHQQHLTISKKIGDRPGEGASLGNLGSAYYALDDYETAIEFQQQSLAIAKEIGNHLGEGASLGNLGLAYDSLGDYVKAIDFHKQYLAISKKIGDRLGKGSALGNLGLSYNSLGEYEKAIDFHQKSLAIQTEIGNRWGIANSLNSAGVSYENLNQYPQAEENLYRSINHWELLRQNLKDASQISIFDTHIYAYRNLQRVLLAQEKNRAALEVSERGRSRALIQLLARSLPQASQQLAIELPNIELFKTVAQQQNATLVEYSLLSNQALVIWVITPTGEIHMEKVPLTDLNTSIETLAQNNRLWLEKARGSDTTDTEITKILRGNQTIAFNPNTNTPPQTSKDTLRKLHQYLIEPIAQYLPHSKEERVIFIPHRSLFQVPFAALMDDTGNYLIHSHTIHTAPSIHSLVYTQQHQTRVSNQAQEVLIVGNPTIPPAANQANPTKPLEQLQGTEKEAYGIAKQIKGASPLIGNQATETEVKRRLHQARLIHFATHGVFSDPEGNPIQGYIVLAESKADKEDGLLTVGEIIKLTQGKLLNAEMVVLSACETGVGDIRGEGVVGLSRALIAAGVPSVIVSLWNVEDESTSLLMQHFYSNLLEEKMDKAKALRHAMLKVSEDYPDPKHWAAFTLIGEAE